MTLDDRTFRKALYAQLELSPLEPSDPRYLQPVAEEHDVVERLRGTIDISRQSVQLLSGYRGTGKSTELRRLRRDLVQEGHFVALIDIEEHLDLNTPVDIVDFLLGVAGALGDALRDESMLGADPLVESVWGRFSKWLGSEVRLNEVGLDAEGVVLKAELKANPTFRQLIQQHVANSIGRFAAEVRGFVGECVLALRKRHGGDASLVLIVDSIEHARGTTANEADIFAGVERLFGQHDDKLRLPDVHVIYTVPPWLRVRRPNIGSLYDGEGLYVIPAHKVRERGTGDAPGAVYTAGVDHLRALVHKRGGPGDIDRLLGDAENLDRIILQTGGHLRDLMRALVSVMLRARTLPATREVVDSALAALREQLLPIPLDDARWLAKIARSRSAELAGLDALGDLTRYFEGHLVLSYRNGEAWYDVHPLVRDHVLELARRAESEASEASGSGDVG